MVRSMTGCVLAAALNLLGGVLTGCSGHLVQEYAASDQNLINPMIGYAHSADSSRAFPDCALVYIDITWRELEPEEGVFAWEAIEEENHVERWKSEGKHAVLRFVCDKPSDEAHMDIPDWLYKKTGGGGTHYDMEYGKGYSPDYDNETFIACHERAIRALGERFGSDSFYSYVELGSLGHWGEWHVKYDAGIKRIPMQSVRERYVAPYLEAFPDAGLLMRRPFAEGAARRMGVYNDMAGDPDSTDEWLGWIGNGGIYNQTGEACITAVPTVWDYAPVGGEFTSGIPMKDLLGKYRSRTMELLTRSHTTFLGPKIPVDDDGNLLKGADEVLRSLGYRLRISRMEVKSSFWNKNPKVSLEWHNDGTAPLYWDWPVYLYLLSGEGAVLEKIPVKLSLKSLTGGASMTTETVLDQKSFDQAAALGVGIEDPMTGKPAVYLAMDAPNLGAVTILYEAEE